jgi:hypothetical protein
VAEEYWVGFRPQPKEIDGNLISFELSVVSSLSLPVAYARVSTSSGFATWAHEINKIDPRLGGRIDFCPWEGLRTEGAFSQFNLGKSVEFTLEAFGLLRFTFAESRAGMTIRLSCSKVETEGQVETLKTDALRLLNAVAKN